MDEHEQPDDAVIEEPILVAPGAEGDTGPEVAPEVAFVIPPPVDDAISTADEATAPEEFHPGEILADPAPVLEAIGTLGETLAARLDGLNARFDREVRAEAAREKVVDRLHAELQEYKQGLLLGILRPVFVDLIQLHDDIGKMTDGRGSGDGSDEAARLLDLIAGVRQGIEDVLYRQGVEPFTVEGNAFDPRRQRALSTVPNDDPALSKTVAARLRKGFQAGDKVIRPEMVTVYAAAPRRDP